jgi:hypothetical protein
MKAIVSFLLIALTSGVSSSAEGNWKAVLHADDFIVGQDLHRLTTHHRWKWKFEEGFFEIAVRKSAIPIPAPKCRMHY